ncbi:MAG: response regulator transcription factor [Cyanobacteria bacterium J06573_11]
MEDIVICAAQPLTRAGLAAMATTATTQVIAKVESISALNNWLQRQYDNACSDLFYRGLSIVDIVVIEFSFLRISDCESVLQTIEDLPADEAIAIVLLIEDFDPEVTTGSLLTQLMSSGMVSLLPMSVSAGAFQSVIATITHGFTILHPDLSDILFTRTQTALTSLKAQLNTQLEDPLTPREIEVLNELASGLTNRAIAQSLNISEHTVKFHISAILSKLNVASRTEAVAVGIRTGLVML